MASTSREEAEELFVPRLSSPEPINRRGMILRAAADSFAEVGFQRTTLEDICTGAGIAKPTLYHHFPSKAAILHEVLEDYIEALIAAADDPQRRQLPPDEQLLEFMKDMVASLDSRPGQVRCFYDNAFDFLPNKARDHIGKRREYYNRQLRRLLREGRDAGVFDFDDDAITPLAIYGMCGWAYNWYRPRGPISAEEIATRMWRLIMSGIGAAGFDPSATKTRT